jgi:NAD(P)-dependent dehydrogenase (short-subunit alcohol dehydrogenase family)
MNRRFGEKVALVTGAGSGIGRATALAFAAEGAKVAVSDIDRDGGEDTVRLIKDLGGEAFFVAADVAEPEQVEAMVLAVVDRYGRLDLAVNNAGIEGALAPTAEYTEEAWGRVIAINLTGVWRSMRAEIPELLKAGGGAIVNVSSILGVVGFATAPAYTAAKHGVLGLTKVAAMEYAPQGIRINAVCPAFIETPMVMERGVEAGKHPEVLQQIAELHPIGRLGKPEEVAAAILWLASEEATFMAGHALVADGGYTAR